jgi:hypothetical protein
MIGLHRALFEYVRERLLTGMTTGPESRASSAPK